MGLTGTFLPHTAGPRWTGERNGFRPAILLAFCLALGARLLAQDGAAVQTFSGGLSSAIASDPASVRGTVINAKTHEPIAKALVYTPDNRYATLTDDRGHFEFKFPPPEKSSPPPPTSGSDTEGMRKYQQWYQRNARPGVFLARRPGFLPDPSGARVPQTGGDRAEIVITLEPEALIVGHVQLPGVDNTDRVQLQLYRQEFEEGHERWTQAGGFTTWASGEFRFPELPAGTYKLFTVERLERDPAIFNPRDQLYGFPPVFYPNDGNFATAAPIRLAAGATFQATLTVTRREYYPVKIGVMNPPAAGYPAVEVFLRGHPGPGYSMGYDAAEQVVRGFLPDGGYTLKVSSQGDEGSSGSLNFSVRGGAVEGPVVNLYPNVSLSVNITREFGAGESPTGTGESNEEGAGSRGNVTIALATVEQFGMGQTVMSQPVPGGSEERLMMGNVAAGTYWMQISTVNCYPASATWGGGDVLHRPITVGAEGASTPIEVTLRNDGAEVSGKVQFPESAGSQKLNEAAAMMPTVFIYFVPLGENGGQLRRTQLWQNEAFDEKQIAPGTYRILAFDHLNTEIGPANAEFLRRYESKGVVVELSAGQTLRLSSPLALVKEP
jgi:hypothetical protein